ncbi:hypothetical protein TTHERM_00693110 (macronuclear) [Tetrahymena thermophila SB210]|uniref:Uncharacterized protein n=1 Tax=Tetrahymena thermophila (strain SB210) TaxID=312017 RepID=Q245A6_TETTS|nr:hypothetical protein TTHERM_00693110 [Tetrahymena thermophila SB210]EAS03331.2 hypothetical protein TTHERM_00693110 [Tetrahymena thermophila SB210]|eukprot:XP_001023576.2 hypothetical protein TTHERM_00693110 [Tetrahymena thermophila SB210]
MRVYLMDSNYNMIFYDFDPNLQQFKISQIIQLGIKSLVYSFLFNLSTSAGSLLMFNNLQNQLFIFDQDLKLLYQPYQFIGNQIVHIYQYDDKTYFVLMYAPLYNQGYPYYTSSITLNTTIQFTHYYDFILGSQLLTVAQYQQQYPFVKIVHVQPQSPTSTFGEGRVYTQTQALQRAKKISTPNDKISNCVTNAQKTVYVIGSTTGSLIVIPENKNIYGNALLQYSLDLTQYKILSQPNHQEFQACFFQDIVILCKIISSQIKSIVLMHVIAFTSLGAFIFTRQNLVQVASFQPPGATLVKGYYFSEINTLAYITNEIRYGQVKFYSLDTLQSTGSVVSTFPELGIGTVINIFYDSANSAFIFADTYGNFYYTLYGSQLYVFNVIGIYEFEQQLISAPIDFFVDFRTNQIYHRYEKLRIQQYSNLYYKHEGLNKCLLKCKLIITCILNKYQFEIIFIY